MKLVASRVLAACAIAALGGCSSDSSSGSGGGALAGLWPFGSGETPEMSRKPANAVEYLCDGGATLYLRNMDANSVWLIAPDRELRLDKKAEGRYGYGRVELDVDKDRIDLIDPPTNQVNCKRVGGTPARK